MWVTEFTGCVTAMIVFDDQISYVASCLKAGSAVQTLTQYPHWLFDSSLYTGCSTLTLTSHNSSRELCEPHPADARSKRLQHTAQAQRSDTHDLYSNLSGAAYLNPGCSTSNQQLATNYVLFLQKIIPHLLPCRRNPAIRHAQSCSAGDR